MNENDPFTLEPQRTALILIDLQKGILGMPCVPHSADAVVKNAQRLLSAFRATQSPVFLVNVGFLADGRDRLTQPCDSPMVGAGTPSPDWSTLVPEVGPEPTDILITKHQWGAFYGTELELQLRRRGVEAIVIGGVATNFGVESTARDAWERNFSLVFAEDAMSSRAEGAHEFAVKNIFPRLGRVRSTDVIVKAFHG